MLYNVTQGSLNSFSEEESLEGGVDWLRNVEAFDNLLLKQKSNKYERKLCETGEEISQYLTIKSPTIMIQIDDIDDIEIATIESCFERNLSPEGNVKYKNYKVMASFNVPIRMYSPSGDINTTPKKGKIVSKYELSDDFMIQRDNILKLINESSPRNDQLKAIIRRNDLSRQIIEALRQTTESSMGDYISFLSSVNYSPSPSFSIFSEDTIQQEMYESPSTSPDPTFQIRTLHKSKSIDTDNKMNNIFYRQISVPSDGINHGQMCLSDELNQAERSFLRSHTPKTMYNYDSHYFQRPISSLSGRTTPLQSKKLILKNFIQRNMIIQSANRDKLAKLALAIEEDNEEIEYGSMFISSAKMIKNRVTDMLDEIKDLKDDLMEIQDDIQENDIRVMNLLEQTRELSTDFDVLHYLDDIISLLNDNFNLIGFRHNWPFLLPRDIYKKNPNLNLII